MSQELETEVRIAQSQLEVALDTQKLGLQGNKYRIDNKEIYALKGLVEKYEQKRMFICCDGTWKNAPKDATPMTNVAKLARAVDRLGIERFKLPAFRRKNDPDANLCDEPDEQPGHNYGTESPDDYEIIRYGFVRQIVYYSSGVGTQSALAADETLAGATGRGLTANVLNAYCFICNNYNFASTPKDEIILVGFSRGGYTVRCLASFIDTVGLLRRRGLAFLRMLWLLWEQEGNNQRLNPLSGKLKDTLEALSSLRRHPVPIKVLAEWDTVSAIGIRSALPIFHRDHKLSFINNTLPSNVENAFLAVALNEKRGALRPIPWVLKDGHDSRVEQCAFVGCHSDIGGGTPDPGLSTITLFWMISKIMKSCNARFDNAALLQMMTPCVVKNPRHRGGKKIDELHNLASTKGNIHESLTASWKLVRLGLFEWCRPNRYHMLKKLSPANGEAKFELHFTARLLMNSRKGEIQCDVLEKLVAHGVRAKCTINESKMEKQEYELLASWFHIANKFRANERGYERIVECDGDRSEASPLGVDWTAISRALYGKDPKKGLQEGALIDLIGKHISCAS